MKKYSFLILLFTLNSLFAKTNNTYLINTLTRKDSIKNNVKVLLDSTFTYRYGSYCSKNGKETEGSVAINYLLKTNSIKEIKTILDGNNNEGKIFAVHALLHLATSKKITLSSTEKVKVKTIINQDKIIKCCEGCMYSERTAISIFEGKYYKRLLKKNKIKL